MVHRHSLRRSGAVIVIAAWMVTMPSIAQAAPGDLDPTFGGDGEVTTHFTAWSDESANAVAIQADGKIVAAGGTFSAFYHDKFALARYNSDGTLDTTFGGDGTVTTHFAAESSDLALAVAIQADRKIVAAGVSSVSHQKFALARYNADGKLDTSFGGDGKVTTHFAAGSEDGAHAVAIQANGKIVAAGNSHLSNERFALARYNSDGKLDTSFGGDGKVTTHFAAESSDMARAVAIQADGKIVTAGLSSVSHQKFALARYNADGKLDTSFGGDGKVTTRFAAGSYDFASAVAIQPDGKVVAAGDSSSPFLYFDKFALARYNSDGKLDTSFGGDGTVTTHFAAESEDGAHAVAIQADRKIVAAGGSFHYHAKFALARYKPGGRLDTSFGGDGKVTTHFTAWSDESANALAIQADGKIVAAGGTISAFYHDKFALARYLPA